MPSKNSKKSQGRKKDFLKSRLDKINTVLNRVEGEVESLVKRLVRQGERSSRDLRRQFDEVLKKIKKNDLYTKAQEKTGDLEREFRRLADDVVSKVKGLEIGPSGFTAKKLIKDARKSLDGFVNLVEKSDLLSLAKNKAESTRNEILSFFSIPSQTDVEKLEKKIQSLEKRLVNLSSRAA
ncbi:MAG: hypothetical protein U1F57_03030 [bacterium]